MHSVFMVSVLCVLNNIKREIFLVGGGGGDVLQDHAGLETNY